MPNNVIKRPIQRCYDIFIKKIDIRKIKGQLVMRRDLTSNKTRFN